MLQTPCLLAILCAFLASPALRGAEPVEAITPNRDPIHLFNGRDLSGFYTWLVDTKRADPRQVFSVTNGLLRISGEGLGYLSTDREYQNYHLIAEFKWGTKNWAWGGRVGKARDSGIFLHSFGPEGNSYDGQGAFKAALECNLFQGATGDFLLIRGTNSDGSILAPRLTAEVGPERDGEGWHTWLRHGRRQTVEGWGRLNWYGKDRQWKDELDFRGPRDWESPYGEWTRVECICRGNRITVKINGAVVNDAFEVSPRSGKILLQCEGSEIFFRRLELRPLRIPTESPAPPGRRVKLTEGQLFIPDDFEVPPTGVDLTLHLHGGGVVEKNFALAQVPGVLFTVGLPGLSEVYTKRFRDTNVFHRILRETLEELRPAGQTNAPRLRQLAMTSFSAGFGGVRELLKNPAAFARIDALIMSDSIYAGFTGNPAERKVDPALMEGFLRFAREAAAGRKRLVISHTQLITPTYANTAETADYLIAQLGGRREPREENWPGDLRLLSRFHQGQLQIYGFAGNTGADHMKHLHNLWQFFERLMF